MNEKEENNFGGSRLVLFVLISGFISVGMYCGECIPFLIGLYLTILVLYVGLYALGYDQVVKNIFTIKNISQKKGDENV